MPSGMRSSWSSRSSACNSAGCFRALCFKHHVQSASVGTKLIDAILSRDYPVVQAFTVIVALFFVLVNIMVDISYAYLDPRIRTK